MMKLMETGAYNTNFYKYMDKAAYTGASAILPIVLSALPGINSAIDFGCGQGVWLSVLQKLGVKGITGLDGLWVDKDCLAIEKECFIEANLEKEISLEKKYDLAISLEVAEHLPEQSAKIFIKSICDASDIVLFSAAIPFQGGTNHVNEQWPDYWSKLFNDNGYIAIDFLRKLIWDDINIPSYYKQNIILYVKKEKKLIIRIRDDINHTPMSLVHPEIYNNILNNYFYEIPLWKLYKIGLKRLIKKIFGQKLIDYIKPKLVKSRA